MTEADARKLAAAHGQQHLLAFWDELTPEHRQELLADIESVDFALMGRLFQKRGSEVDWAELSRRAEPPPAVRLSAARDVSAEATRRGEAALRAGQVAVILVAGGQGTRLGFQAPKGMFAIGPVSSASLFQILLEKIVATGRRYGRTPPLYVMTSPATHAETVAYMNDQKRFGLAESDVTFFCQGTMPAVDIETGRLILAAKSKLFRNPDGHGGMLAALERSGGLADMERRGIRHVFYLQVDNPLATICDPAFIGHHLLADSEMTTQVVAKQAPLERLGNFVSVAGQVQIIEYSDLPSDVAHLRNPDGSLKFWAGSIGVHVFEVAFLRRMSQTADALPFHAAKKKVPFVDEQGALLQPPRENAIKFERFIFDLLPQAKRGIAVESDLQETFAPVKNANGEAQDTPESVQRQMIALHTGWLTAAGANVKSGTPVEIGPLFALDQGEVAQKIQPGTAIDTPTYFGE